MLVNDIFFFYQKILAIAITAYISLKKKMKERMGTRRQMIFKDKTKKIEKNCNVSRYIMKTAVCNFKGK